MFSPRRKPLRIRGYDYSTPGAYFITICTAHRRPILSKISVGQGLAPAEVCLSTYGTIAEQTLLQLPSRFPSLRIDRYVIMPNHIHLLLSLTDSSPQASVPDVIRTYKSLTTRACHMPRLFQPSYYDHIIRNQEDYDAVWEYIENNPLKWVEDHLYMASP